MALLRDLINTVGLDISFFYQLFLAIIVYFISKKLFFQPYLENFKKSQKLTKGSLKSSEEIEKSIEEKKVLYEQKAKSVHEKFQETFSKIKNQSQKDYLLKTSKLQEEQRNFLDKERKNLNQSVKTQEDLLKQDVPSFVSLLVEKIKG